MALIRGFDRRDNLTAGGEMLEAWRKDYNQNRPHSSLGNLTAAEYELLHTEK